MSSAQTLRYLILTMWVTAIVSVVLDFSLESRLPEPLRDYLAAKWDEDFTLRDVVVSVVGLIGLWFLVQGSIHLYGLRAKGRRQFLIGLVTSTLTVPLFGPVVSNPWVALLSDVFFVLTGIIVGLIYFSAVQLELSS
jgi:hypothetical protein